MKWAGGTPRVEGRLAVSRAFGDKALKPYVVADPDVKCLDITDDCEFLIVASDGCARIATPSRRSTPMMREAPLAAPEATAHLGCFHSSVSHALPPGPRPFPLTPRSLWDAVSSTEAIRRVRVGLGAAQKKGGLSPEQQLLSAARALASRARLGFSEDDITVRRGGETHGNMRGPGAAFRGVPACPPVC